jgi:predicted  nucleic acid-binding Zn-ribbon protein
MNWLHRMLGAEADKEELESLRARYDAYKRNTSEYAKRILDLECENAKLKEEKSKAKKEVRRLNYCLQFKANELKGLRSDTKILGDHYYAQRELLKQWQETYPMNSRGGPKDE